MFEWFTMNIHISNNKEYIHLQVIVQILCKFRYFSYKKINFSGKIIKVYYNVITIFNYKGFLQGIFK